MNRFKIFLIISLMYTNIHPNLYDLLPKNNIPNELFMLRWNQKYLNWRDGAVEFQVGSNELLSYMYYDTITNFKDLKKENLELKKQITRLESKIDLILAKFDMPPPAYENQ